MKPLLLLLLLFSLPVHADGWVAAEQIRNSALAFAITQLDADAEAQAASLDPRLRLPACALPLRSSAEGASRQTLTVKVQCDAPSVWSVYVPLRISQRRTVLVAARALARGERIDASSLRREPRDLAALGAGTLELPELAIGKLLRRPLAAGTAIAADALEAPKLVRRGETVTLIGRVAGIEVRSQGKALDDGVEGASIGVENSSSRRRVQALVLAAGLVEVAL